MTTARPIFVLSTALLFALLAGSSAQALPFQAVMGGGTGLGDITFRTPSGASSECTFSITGELVDTIGGPRLAYAVGPGVGADAVRCAAGADVPRTRLMDASTGNAAHSAGWWYFWGPLPPSGGASMSYSTIVGVGLAITTVEERWIRCAASCEVVLHVEAVLFGPGVDASIE